MESNLDNNMWVMQVECPAESVCFVVNNYYKGLEETNDFVRGCVNADSPLAKQGCTDSDEILTCQTVCNSDLCNTNNGVPSGVEWPPTPGQDSDLDFLEKAGWTLTENGNVLYKEYIFWDFNEAFGFMTRVALRAEKMRHYPQWLNIYDKVRVTLRAQRGARVSDLDIELAMFMESVV